MAVEVVMPRLGWTMETASVAEWVKHDGEAVRSGEILFTVETDKVAQEVEAAESGILRIAPDSVQPGRVVPVGTVLAYLVQPGERAPFDEQPVIEEEAAPAAEARASEQQAENRLSREPAYGKARRAVPAASPRARRVARELGVAWRVLAGSGRSGRIVERDVRAAASVEPEPRVRVSPLARRVARQEGVDLAELAGRMPDKRITVEDVQASLHVGNGSGLSAVEIDVRAGEGWTGAEDRALPIGQRRRIIAARMAESVHTTAPVTLTTEADATELVALRERIKQALSGGARVIPSYSDLVVRVVALVLREHPRLNSTLEGDTIVEHEAVHMGLAVDTDQGLLVPVLRDAHLKSVQTIATESAALIARARGGKPAPEELGGSTFTVSNLGMYDIDAFTPIINLPNCAILGMGRIVARQVVTDEERDTVAIRKMLALSLTFDHRLVDGAPAARFLQQVKRWVEQPHGWVIA